MLEIAEKYASADAAIKAPLTLGSTSRLAVDDPARRSIVEPGPGPRRDRRNDKRKDGHPDVQYGSAQVAAVENAEPAPPPSRRQRAAAGGNGAWPAKGKYTFESMLDSPCKFHSGGNKPATHTTRQCGWMKRASNGEGLPAPPPLPAPAPDRGAPAPAPNPPPRNNYNQNNDDDDDDRRQPQGAAGGRLQVQATYHVFTTERNDKRAQRRRAMEVNAVAHTGHRYMDWSHRPVAWDRNDHPDVMPTPGGYALVVNTMIIADSESIAVNFSRALIDGGSSINILYKETLEKLDIREKDLDVTTTVFHGVIPGLSCTPLGKIKLDVAFGTPDHFRREAIWFEVVDLPSPYHMLLGRPALAKFMAVPHYAYLKLKMPGPQGTITVNGDYRKSIDCAVASSELAEALIIAEEKKQLMKAVNLAQSEMQVPAAHRPTADMSFKPAQDTKKIRLEESDPTRCVSVGVGLSPA